MGALAKWRLPLYAWRPGGVHGLGCNSLLLSLHVIIQISARSCNSGFDGRRQDNIFFHHKMHLTHPKISQSIGQSMGTSHAGISGLHHKHFKIAQIEVLQEFLEALQLFFFLLYNFYFPRRLPADGENKMKNSFHASYLAKFIKMHDASLRF